MEYRFLGGSGLKVSALGFGAGTFGGKGPLFRAWGQSDIAEATRLVEISLEAGGNLFAPADAYPAAGGSFGARAPSCSSWGQTGSAYPTRFVEISLEAGVTLFDTADVYSDGAS